MCDSYNCNGGVGWGSYSSSSSSSNDYNRMDGGRGGIRHIDGLMGGEEEVAVVDGEMDGITCFTSTGT